MNKRLAILLAVLCPTLLCAQSSKPGDERWDFRFGIRGVDGEVLAATSWGGKPCIGGRFHVAGTSVAQGVALWNGHDWEQMGEGLSDDSLYSKYVCVLANWRGTLYAGGDFTRSGTNPVQGLAWWTGTNWSPVGGGGGLSGVVRALVPASDGLYIAGSIRLPADIFPTDTNNYGLIRWTGLAYQTYGSVIKCPTDTYPYPPVVTAIALKGPEIFISGDFDSIAGLPIKYNARWTGGNWETMGMGISNGILRSMAVHQGQLYASAYLPWTGNPDVTNIARWDGTNWWPLGVGLGDVCDSLISDDTNLYATGNFTNSGDVLLDKVAVWNGSEWRAMGNSVWANNERPSSLGIDLEGNIYALGYFTSVHGESAEGIAKWNQYAWEPVGPSYALGLQRFLSITYSMAAINGRLLVGGLFSAAGSNTVNAIGILETNQWKSLGSGIKAGTSGQVRAMTVSGNNVIAGGTFTNAGEAMVRNLACWDGEQWRSFGGGTTGTVYSLATYGNQTMVGGDFAQIGGSNINYLAAWNGTNWSALGAGVDARVTALQVSQGRLYVGGRFANANGLNVNQVAAWDGVAWQALGTGLGGTNVIIANAFASDGTNLYVGGQFQNAGGVPAHNVARWDGSAWWSLGQGAENGVSGSVSALAVRNGRVYVGGIFTRAGSISAMSLAMWDGTNWSGFGSGLTYPGLTHTPSARVFALATDEHALYVGGMFLSAGNKCSAAIARWVDEPAITLRPPILAPNDGILLPIQGLLGLRFEVQESMDLRHWLSNGYRLGLDDQLTIGPLKHPPRIFYRCRLIP